MDAYGQNPMRSSTRTIHSVDTRSRERISGCSESRRFPAQDIVNISELGASAVDSHDLVTGDLSLA